MIQEAILNPPLTFMGSGGQESPVEDQFIKYTYPIAKEKGGTEIHMIWTDTPCRTTCWNHGNWTIDAFQNPKIECIVAQHPWLENDALYADIILPANTTLEVEDIVTNTRQGPHFQSIALQEKAIEPIGESKSDYEVVLEIAKKLGMGKKFTEGKTTQDLEKEVFDNMGWTKSSAGKNSRIRNTMSSRSPKTGRKIRPVSGKFYEDPEKNPLPTPTGKLEFYSASVWPSTSRMIKKDRLTPSGLKKARRMMRGSPASVPSMFPLLLMSNHGRWRTHAQCDDITWTREALTCKVKGWDGYMYEPCLD